MCSSKLLDKQGGVLKVKEFDFFFFMVEETQYQESPGRYSS